MSVKIPSSFTFGVDLDGDFNVSIPTSYRIDIPTDFSVAVKELAPIEIKPIDLSLRLKDPLGPRICPSITRSVSICLDARLPASIYAERVWSLPNPMCPTHVSRGRSSDL